MIFISSDHGGFEIKKELAKYLESTGVPFEDLGPYEFDPDDDYPDYVAKVVEKMKAVPGSKGVLLCRNGVGVTMAANRHSGIRAGLSWNESHAITSRQDDDTNVLTLPADYINSRIATAIVKAWLETPFNGEERHKRRLAKIL